jgi:replicative DNA helicase
MKVIMSLEAEQALLGALFISPEAWDEVGDSVRPDLFCLTAHQHVAGAMLDLRREQKPVDAMLVYSALEAKGLVPEAVPSDLLFALCKGIGISGNVRHYLEHLESLWARRGVAELARRVLEDESDRPGQEVVGWAMSELSRLEVRRARKASKLGAVIERRIEQIGDQRKGDLGDRLAWTGFKQLDWMTGGLRWGNSGSPIIVGARPQIGKTAFGSALADNVASQGVPVGVFQLEDEEGSLADRAIARRAQINSMLLRDGVQLKGEHWSRIMGEDFNRLLELPIFVDDQHGLTAQEIAGRMRRMKRDHGCRVFIVDHGKEIRLESRRDGRTDLAIGDTVRVLRDACKDVEAVLVLLWQLSRETERRTGAIPQLSDLKDSGELEAIARGVWMLARSKDGKGLDVHVCKNTAGPVGEVTLRWLEDWAGVEDPPNVTGGT